ncbi:MAG: 3-hydroxyacyl-ACP dehydratase FabZ [Tissierellia bacterium]|nr:3-hydroxyacyl-ACP dehydratase FabZ [Tissierellia bacterium]
MDILPHRYPFLLVDKVLEGEAGVWARGIKQVSLNEPHFMGHFPDYPLMPGVLIIEALAQLGALCVLSLEEHRGKLVLFGGVDKMRFKKEVLPGDSLELYCKILGFKMGIGKGEVRAMVDGEIVAQGQLTFSIK